MSFFCNEVEKKCEKLQKEVLRLERELAAVKAREQQLKDTLWSVQVSNSMLHDIINDRTY